jgi:hypothetical protein
VAHELLFHLRKKKVEENKTNIRKKIEIMTLCAHKTEKKEQPRPGRVDKIKTKQAAARGR